MLTMEQTERIDDDTGRAIIRFTPVFRPVCTASGEVRFACYEEWKDSPLRKIEVAYARAMANACQVIAGWAKDTAELS